VSAGLEAVRTATEAVRTRGKPYPVRALSFCILAATKSAMTERKYKNVSQKFCHFQKKQ
jgi:thermostable 8-oxoguanine DNA glycosylase